MFRKNRQHDFLSRQYVWLWMALAFQAGFANAGGFLACSRFVSHMTGFGTMVGISLSRSDYWVALEMGIAPLCFVVGAITSAFFVDWEMDRDRPPRYLMVMFLIFVLFSVVTVCGVSEVFGSFGDPNFNTREFVVLAVLCYTCGMQNACFSALTRGQIRTTHMTGIATDLGTSTVRLTYLDPQDRNTKILKRINAIRFATFCSFSAGSAVSAIIFNHLNYRGFSLLMFSSLTLLVAMAIKQRSADLRTEELLETAS